MVLRVEKRGGIIRAGVSRDLDTFTILPGEVKTADLGNIRRIGVQALIAHWTGQLDRPPARIYWVRLEPVTPDYLVRRNVP